MHKIKPGTFIAGVGKSNFKGTIERFVARDNAFSFMSSVKGTLSYCKQFFYDVLAMVKQLGIPSSLTLSRADRRSKELWYIIIKLNNLALSDKELKNLSFQQGCNLLNNNPVLVAKYFQYKVEVFFTKIILDDPLWTTNIMLFMLNVKKGVVYRTIHLYGFSMH